MDVGAFVGVGVRTLVAVGRVVRVGRGVGKEVAVGLVVETIVGWLVGVLDEEGWSVGAGLDGVMDDVEIVGVVCAEAWHPHMNAPRTTIRNVLFITALMLAEIKYQRHPRASISVPL